MSFVLGTRTRRNIARVHPQLVAVLEKAISISTIDFGVPEQSWRTLAEQAEKVRQGVSKTMRSNHLIKSDGFGWAVDVVPYINGRYTWDGNAEKPDYTFYQIAVAMDRAADSMGVPLTWGAVWDRRLSELNIRSGADALAARNAYNARHPGRDFNDYPHYQLEID